MKSLCLVVLHEICLSLGMFVHFLFFVHTVVVQKIHLIEVFLSDHLGLFFFNFLINLLFFQLSHIELMRAARFGRMMPESGLPNEIVLKILFLFLFGFEFVVNLILSIQNDVELILYSHLFEIQVHIMHIYIFLAVKGRRNSLSSESPIIV